MFLRAGKASPARAMARAVGEGFDCFLFGLVLLAFGGCSPQAGSRQRRAGQDHQFSLRARAQKISAIARLVRKAPAACYACLPAAALHGAGRLEFGKARMLSRIATAGTYARQRQKGVPSYGCQYTEQPSQHWPKDPQKSVGQCRR